MCDMIKEIDKYKNKIINEIEKGNDVIIKKSKEGIKIQVLKVSKLV